MKKKSLKMLSLLIALLTIVSVFASCGLYSDDETTNSSSSSVQTNNSNNENVPELASTWPEFAKKHSATVTWFEQGWTGLDSKLDIITPEIEKRTNFKMGYTPMTVPTADDYTQKLNLMVASNDIPDIFFGGNDAYTRTIYEKLGATEALWDLTDIIKEEKNIYDLVYPELTLYKSKEGKNFFIPTQTGRGNEVLNEPPHGLYLRKDFLDKMNMEYPKTPEELYTYLKRAKAEITVKGQKVNGLVLGENLSGIEQLYEPFFPLTGDHESYTLPFDPEDGYKVKNYEYTNSPEILKAAKFINKLSKEGLLDREALTIKQSQFQEKASSGLSSAITSAWWDMNTYSDNAKAEVPEIFYVAPPQIFETKEIEQSRLRPWTNWVGGWSSVIVSKKIDEETLHHFLAVMDYITTKDGQLLTQAGIEGTTFEWDKDNKYKFTEDFKTKTNNLDFNKSAQYGIFYYAQMAFNIPAIADLQQSSPALERKDNKINWENQKARRDVYQKDMKPTKDYYFLPGQVESGKFPAIKDAKLEFWAKIVAAKSEAQVESLVNEWGKTCESMGINEIIAERQAYIDNFKN